MSFGVKSGASIKDSPGIKMIPGGHVAREGGKRGYSIEHEKLQVNEQTQQELSFICTARTFQTATGPDWVHSTLFPKRKYIIARKSGVRTSLQWL